MRGLPEIGCNPSHDGLRIEQAVPPEQAGREIRDAKRALPSVQLRLQHGGVFDIALFAADMVVQFDRENAIVGGVFRRPHQPVEDRVAVKARQAIPDDPGVLVDQRRDSAVSDDAEVEIVHSMPAILHASSKHESGRRTPHDFLRKT